MAPAARDVAATVERADVDLSRGWLSGLPNGRIIDFEFAELRKPAFQDSLYLWVKAIVPALGFEARLVPRIYHDRPDYWGIEVVALAAMKLATDAPVDEPSLAFERSVPLVGITGSHGIRIIGATRVEQIEIPGES